MGKGAIAPHPDYATEKYIDCCSIGQHSHLTALFEVFYVTREKLFYFDSLEHLYCDSSSRLV